MSDRPETIAELISKTLEEGRELTIPETDRVVRIRPLDVSALLDEGKVPDILTPIIVKAVYSEVSDSDAKNFVFKEHTDLKELAEHLAAIDYVVKHSLVGDNPSPKQLTLREKRWIFRLAMIPAEYLATFRWEQDDDVADVAEGEDVQPVAEPNPENQG